MHTYFHYHPQSAYLTSFAKVPPSDNRHHDPLWDTPAQRARRRADTNLNRQFQQRSGTVCVTSLGWCSWCGCYDWS